MKRKVYFFTIIFFAVITLSYSQDLLFVAKQIKVTSTGTLNVKGGIKGSASGEIDNNGDIYIKQHSAAGSENWTNNVSTSFLTGNGTVIFNSSEAQQITGNFSTTFNNLTIDNSSGFSIASALNHTITGTLTLTNGALNLNGNKLIINNSSTTAISYTNGYILSNAEDLSFSSGLQWNIGTTTGIHEIPYGVDGSNMIPFIIDLNSGNIGNVTVSTYPSNGSTPTLVYADKPTVVTNLIGINTGGGDPGNAGNIVKRFWYINPSGESSPDADITFTYASSEEPINGEDVNMIAQRYNETIDGWEVNYLTGQTSNTTTNTVTVPNVTSFSPWAVTRKDNILPVELLYFTAEWKEQTCKDVKLKWETASEINSDYFEIQRVEAHPPTPSQGEGEDLSSNFNWEIIGNVDAAGNSSTILYYEFIDKVLSANWRKDLGGADGLIYYRLKQTDFDGSVQYSDIVAISKQNKYTDEIIAVYPNPANKEINILMFLSRDKTVTILILNITGKKVIKQKKSLKKGLNNVNLHIGSLNKGCYLLKITSKENVIQKKIIVE